MKFKKGDRVSGLCMNGTILKSNDWKMHLIKWDFGCHEWVPDSNLRKERKDWPCKTKQN